MSDEEAVPVVHSVIPGPSWLAEKAKRLREEADAASAMRETESTQGIMLALREIAARQVEAFASLPCRGAIDRIAECSDSFSLTCERRTSPSCPREIRAFEVERERVQLLDRLRNVGVPQDSIGALFGDFRPTQATAAVDVFLGDSALRTLVLSGDVGVGKSVAAAYALRRRAGRFMTAAQIAESGRFDEEARDARRAAYETPLLVIDDLGTEFSDGKGWFRSVLEPLLVDRHNRNRQSIVTCNVDARAFAERYGERIADRIAGAGMFVQLAGPSLRARPRIVR